MRRDPWRVIFIDEQHADNRCADFVAAVKKIVNGSGNAALR